MLRKQIKTIISQLSSNNYQTLNRIELNKNNVLSNIKLIQTQHLNFGIIPVLKANAYGHGLEKMATILNNADCKFLAVDGYFEAARIRDLTKHPILIMGYIKPENTALLDTVKCSFVVQDIDGLRAFGELRKPVRVHLELNTGMNRLGLSATELPMYLQTIKKYPNLILEGVMTHLADADNESDDSFTKHQVKEFDFRVDEIKKSGFSPTYIHVAQTAGSTKVQSNHANTIRLGIGLYGINPLNKADNHYKDLKLLKPVLELKSTIIKIIELKKGDKVSYNGTYTAPGDITIGVLPLGYYEGIPRELGNKGVVTRNKIELPIIGKICMNHTMVQLKGYDFQVGDEVTVISKDPSQPNSVERICNDHKLFNYYLITKLSSSIRRIIV
jgi:alanine racemase